MLPIHFELTEIRRVDSILQEGRHIHGDDSIWQLRDRASKCLFDIGVAKWAIAVVGTNALCGAITSATSQCPMARQPVSTSPVVIIRANFRIPVDRPTKVMLI